MGVCGETDTHMRVQVCRENEIPILNEEAARLKAQLCFCCNLRHPVISGEKFFPSVLWEGK